MFRTSYKNLNNVKCMAALCRTVPWHTQNFSVSALEQFFFVFSFLKGPVSRSSRCTAALRLLCSPKYSIQHWFINPMPLMKRDRYFNETMLITFGSANSFPKYLIALTSQCLATTNNMVHSFSHRPAKYAGWISIKEAHNIQLLPHRSMACEECNYQS
jgi:hypothetical protein